MSEYILYIYTVIVKHVMCQIINTIDKKYILQ